MYTEKGNSKDEYKDMVDSATVSGSETSCKLYPCDK